MNSPIRFRFFVILAFILFGLPLTLLAPAPAHAFTDLSFGPAGLESMRHDGVEYLRKPGCFVSSATGHNPAGGRWSPSLSSSRVKVSDNSITRTYLWGSIRCTYSLSDDRVRVGVDIHNITSFTITEVAVQLLTVSLPMVSAEQPRLTRSKSSLEGPDILSLSSGGTILLVASEEVGTLSDLRLQPAPGGASIVLGTGLKAPFPPVRQTSRAEYKWRPVELTRSIPPEHFEHYSVALRFGVEGQSPRELLPDLFERVAARFPHTLRWPDRRPIGMLVLASHGPRTPFDPRNPRYWRFVKPSVDINSAAGRAEFQAPLLEEADRTVAISKQMNAQGLIVWDIEGQEFLGPVSYVGDPRYLAPEMQGVVDRFFKRFTDAGLRCGVMAGARRFVPSSASGEAYQKNSDDPDEIFKIIDDKIQYAQKRWGCTLFYIDSTGAPGWAFDASIFHKLAAKYPDVLLSPENKTIVDYAWTAPYADLRNGVEQLDEGRWLYPDAFSVMHVGIERLWEGDPRWQKLVQGVRSGDILMFPAWYNAPSNQAVLQIYRQAWGPKWPGSY